VHPETPRRRAASWSPVPCLAAIGGREKSDELNASSTDACTSFCRPSNCVTIRSRCGSTYFVCNVSVMVLSPRPRSSWRGPSGIEMPAVTRMSNSWTTRRCGLNATKASIGRPVRSANSRHSARVVQAFRGSSRVEKGCTSRGSCELIPGCQASSTVAAVGPRWLTRRVRG
jgi:hypothetical protein